MTDYCNVFGKILNSSPNNLVCSVLSDRVICRVFSNNDVFSCDLN